MSDVSIGRRGFRNTIAAISLLLILGPALTEGAAARAAKDASERGIAASAAARYLQGQGFADPMLTAEVVDQAYIAVEVDNKEWARMSKAQKLEFLDRVNSAVLTANGGIAIDVHISMSGLKVAASTFQAGQQIIRLLE